VKKVVVIPIVQRTHCVHENNDLAGFVSQHRMFCYVFNCGENAVGHFDAEGRSCGNACKMHLKPFEKRRDVTVEYILRGLEPNGG